MNSKKKKMPANPKQIYGDAKIPLHLMPSIAQIEWAWAAGEGARKYGPYDWHENPVEYMTYIASILRHLIEAVEGVTRDKDSGAHPLGHVMACCSILMDAEANEQIIDNRPKMQNSVLHRMEEYRQKILAKQTPTE